MQKALMNGSHWYQVFSGTKGKASVKLSAMSEKNWYQATVNGNIHFQVRGKKDAVANFNRLLSSVESAVN